jgi:hypothetical protein
VGSIPTRPISINKLAEAIVSLAQIWHSARIVLRGAPFGAHAWEYETVATIRERKKHGKASFQCQVRMTGYPTRTASFPTRRLAKRWGVTIESAMIEGKHFRGVESRRRTLAEAITRYCEEELPGKSDKRTRIIRLNWWKEKLGHVKLADLTAALLVEYRRKLARKQYTRARPGAAGSTLEEGETARTFTRSGPTVNRYLAYLSHVLSVARREWHWLDVNPFDGVGRLKEGTGRVRVPLHPKNSMRQLRIIRFTYNSFTILLSLTPGRCRHCKLAKQRLFRPPARWSSTEAASPPA